MSNDAENISEAGDDGRSPCVRAFVANFERRDSNAGIGNENKPPVMTKSKVALLRQTLGKTSDSVKSTSSDSEIGSRIHEAGDSDGANDGQEQIVSVAKLKQNLQKSASEKPVAPWGFGGVGRSVKETKRPTPKKKSDTAMEVEAKSSKIDTNPTASERNKRKMNNSFKQAQQNLIASPIRTEFLDENVFNNATASDVSSQGTSLPYQLNRSVSGDNHTGEKHKTAPKVLPKPVPRKTKAKQVNVSHERSRSDDKCERTAYQNKNVTLDESSDLMTNRKPGSIESLLGNTASNGDAREVLHPEITQAVIRSEEQVDHLQNTHQTEDTAGSVAREEAFHSASKRHDVVAAHVETTEDCDPSSRDKLNTDSHLEASDKDSVSARDVVPPIATRTHSTDSIDEENSDDDDDREVDNTIVAKESITLSDEELVGRVSSERIRLEQNDRASSSVSSEHVTDLVITDDESLTDDDRRSHKESEPTLLSEGNRTESPDNNLTRSTDSISQSKDSTGARGNLISNGDVIESAPNESDDDKPADDSRFLLCMGPDFVSDIRELSSLTPEEQEYEALAAVVCCKMFEEEEENLRWRLCPTETYRSTVDYVGSLFEDDILVGIGERNFGMPDVEDSSFMSANLLREALLDKATKKLECLKLRKQRLEAAAAKQVEFEEVVDALVKEKVDSRQYSKYRTTLEEFDQVTHLLLMLSSRLANTDNSLDQISFSDQEQQKVQLISKRDNLIEKFKEAGTIKQSSETRRRQVTDCLRKCLTPAEYFDYLQLVKTKCQLKIVRHSLEDRVSLSEEQIKILVAIIEKNTSARYC